jgi:hypothetical protein
MQDKFANAVRSVPFALRLIALVLIYNGIFAMISIIAALLGNNVASDWRMANLIIGIGLLLRQRVWYFAAIVSVIVSVVLHIRSMAMVLLAYQVYGAGGISYLATALVIDLVMLYVLLRHQTRRIFFDLKERK